MSVDQIKNIGVVGSGAMGIGIAQVFAEVGYAVQIYDISPNALEQAEKKLNQILDNLIAKGKMDTNQASKIRQTIVYTSDLATFRRCDLVIEAIVENIKVKNEFFALIEGLVRADCVLASNTSSLSITSIASVCKNPQRVIGLHFFNPAPVMQLVEIIPAIQTNKDLAEDMRGFIAAIGKEPVVVKDTPGFIVNRVARPFYGEAIRLLEEGIADERTIDLAMKTIGGFRMGPFELMDFIGHDVNYKVTESVFEAFYFDPRYKPSLSQKRLCEAGFLGRKTGRGFYDYTASSPSNAEVKNISDVSLQNIHNRILVMLMNEAADALFLNIASRDDLDMAMTKGVNYPKGLLKWADEYGIKRIQQEIDKLYDFYREDRYRLSPLLRKMAEDNLKFYN